MEPVSAMVERKVADSVWGYFRKWFTRNRDLKREIGALKARLDEKAEFERKLSELECRDEDDCLYLKKDSGGPYYCPFCLNDNKKFMPLPRGTGEGSYYCPIHQHTFETKERRERRANYVAQPRTWRGIRRKLEAESRRQAHPQNWMGS